MRVDGGDEGHDSCLAMEADAADCKGHGQFVCWNDFDQANIFTWGFVGGMLFLLIASPMLYLWLEVRRRKGVVVGKEPSGR